MVGRTYGLDRAPGPTGQNWTSWLPWHAWLCWCFLPPTPLCLPLTCARTNRVNDVPRVPRTHTDESTDDSVCPGGAGTRATTCLRHGRKHFIACSTNHFHSPNSFTLPGRVLPPCVPQVYWLWMVGKRRHAAGSQIRDSAMDGACATAASYAPSPLITPTVGFVCGKTG